MIGNFKHWKKVRNIFGDIIWQQGQHHVRCTEGGQPRVSGWKWTTGIKVQLCYVQDANRWNVILHKPCHPAVTIAIECDLSDALREVSSLMKSFEHLTTEYKDACRRDNNVAREDAQVPNDTRDHRSFGL